jgi:hypothetical protein
MNGRHHRNQPPIDLFRKRIVNIAAAQASFDVPDRNLAVVGR